MAACDANRHQSYAIRLRDRVFHFDKKSSLSPLPEPAQEFPSTMEYSQTMELQDSKERPVPPYADVVFKDERASPQSNASTLGHCSFASSDSGYGSASAVDLKSLPASATLGSIGAHIPRAQPQDQSPGGDKDGITPNFPEIMAIRLRDSNPAISKELGKFGASSKGAKPRKSRYQSMFDQTIASSQYKHTSERSETAIKKEFSANADLPSKELLAGTLKMPAWAMPLASSPAQNTGPSGTAVSTEEVHERLNPLAVRSNIRKSSPDDIGTAGKAPISYGPGSTTCEERDKQAAEKAALKEEPSPPSSQSQVQIHQQSVPTLAGILHDNTGSSWSRQTSMPASSQKQRSDQCPDTFGPDPRMSPRNTRSNGPQEEPSVLSETLQQSAAAQSKIIPHTNESLDSSALMITRGKHTDDGDESHRVPNISVGASITPSKDQSSISSMIERTTSNGYVVEGPSSAGSAKSWYRPRNPFLRRLEELRASFEACQDDYGSSDTCDDSSSDSAEYASLSGEGFMPVSDDPGSPDGARSGYKATSKTIVQTPEAPQGLGDGSQSGRDDGNHSMGDASGSQVRLGARSSKEANKRTKVVPCPVNNCLGKDRDISSLL